MTAPVPRWLELQGEIDYRLFLLGEIRRADEKVTPFERLIDEATGHDKAVLAEATEIVAELRELRAEWDELASAPGTCLPAGGEQ